MHENEAIPEIMLPKNPLKIVKIISSLSLKKPEI